MPELVYKVKFEVDSSNLEKITSGIDPSSSKQVQQLNQEIQELKNKLSQVKNIGSGATQGASAGFLDMLQNVRTSTSELNKNISTMKKSVVSTDTTTDSLIKQSDALLDGAIDLQRLREELERAAQQESLTDKQTEILNNTLSKLANTQRSAVSTSNNFNDGLQVIEHQAGTMNKAFAGSNQILFSFSDLVQDSTQFSQGFAQGMRAIGNNVGFTAELFANLSNNVRRHNKLVADGVLKNEKQITTFGALKNSMKGAGGAVIALNGAFMLGTIASQLLEKRLKKLNEQAKSQVEVFSEVAKSFTEIDTGVEDLFGLRAREAEIKLLRDEIGKLPEDFKKVQSQILAGFDPISRTIASIVPDTIFDLGVALGAITEDAGIAAEANKELRIELEKQERVNKAYTDFLNREANFALLQYKNTLDDLNNSLIVLRASSIEGIKVNSDEFKSRVEIIESLREQISVQAAILNSSNISDEQRIKSLNLISRLTGQYKTLTDEIESNRKKVEEVKFQNTLFLSEQQKISFQTNRQILDLELLQEKYPALTAEIEDAITALKKFAAAQKLSTTFDDISKLAAAAGQFGEIFNASKEFRLAMATIDGAAAITSVLADPRLGFFGKLAASASIAAQVAKQIQQIKNTDLGSSGGVATPSGSGGGIISSTPSGSQPTQSITFLPSAASSGQAPPTVDVKIDRAGLAVAVNKGNRELANKQVRV